MQHDTERLVARARIRASDPAWSAWAADVARDAAHFAAVPAPPIPRTNHNWILEEMRWLQRRVLTMALQARIAGDASLGRRAVALVREAESWGEWNWKRTQGPFDLATGEAGATLGWLSDWLGPMLHLDDRATLERIAEERVLAPFLASCPERGDRIWWHTATMNWNAVCNGGALVAALLLPGCASAQAVARVAPQGLARFIEHGINRDGSSSESVGYWSYGLTYLLHAALAHGRAGLGPHPADAAPVFGPAMDFPFLFSLRDGRAYGFGDSNYFRPPPLLLAACADRADIAGEVLTRLRADLGRDPAAYDQLLDYYPAAALALLLAPDDSRAAIAAPAVMHWPDAGWSRLSAGGLHLGMRGGSTEVPHSMRDLAAVTLADDDDILLAMIEHWPYVAGWFDPDGRREFWEDGTGSKSAMLVNGTGQVRRCAAATVRRSDGVSVDATPAYASYVKLARRDASIVDGGLRLVDELAADPPSFLESRFLSQGAFTRIAEHAWRVTGPRGGQALLRFTADVPFSETQCAMPQGDPTRPHVAMLRVHTTSKRAAWRLVTTLTKA